MSELVTDYLERVVSARTRADMWWHLIRCEACRHYYNQVRRTVRLLRQGGQRDSSAERTLGTEERVLAAARQQRNVDPDNA